MFISGSPFKIPSGEENNLGIAQIPSPKRAHKRRVKAGEFRHNHPTYMTCFGCLHVKIATCCVGFFSLLGVCFSLIYCVISSQQMNQVKLKQKKASIKLAALPMIATIVSILYLFIGILRQKAKLLYPFVLLQIISAFALAIMLVMTIICVLCDTKYVLDAFIGNVKDPKEYRLSVGLLITVLICQLCVQLWTTRAVCTCFRYFTDLKRFHVRQSQLQFL